VAQFLTKRFLDVRQYAYLRDLLLVGAWTLLAIWFGSPLSRFVVAAAIFAGIFGLAEGLWLGNMWRWGYFFIGFFCALFGPSIGFINFIDGEYIYLTPLVSVVATSVWFAVFPLVVQQMDGISGLAGHILAVTFSLMLISAALAVSGMQDAFFMSLTGLLLLGAFWSRFNNLYRQAGRAMSAFWGTLAAGTAILGVSKGIVFSSLFFLSLGLYAIPLAEGSLHLVSLMLADASHGPERLYRRLIRRGWDHPDAVRLIAWLCAFLGILAALSQYPPSGYAAGVWWLVLGMVSLVVLIPLVLKYRNTSPMIHAKPRLWGIHIDNVSMNYAISRARGMILSCRGVKLVSTVNALGMNVAVRDPQYHRVLRYSALVLSDGVGLLWGLRFLGMPIQERVTGIDFAEQLCRTASVEGWPVYFLGARGDTARQCAHVMASRYPGLVVTGARNGYFSMEDPTVARDVAQSGTKILFVAMGIPRQEKWVGRWSSALGDVLAVGVGGAFDVLSGQLNRAPRLMQKVGLEWLYRLFQEPSRWKRDMGLVVFVLRILATRMGFYVWKGGQE
jgi:N-acetylglucosaminyldiphosphoundecaprenol N-acetyl-beta-D-mannosaminyltransferase